MRKSCQYDEHYMNGGDTCQCGKHTKEPEEDFSMCQDPEFAKMNHDYVRLLLNTRKGIRD